VSTLAKRRYYRVQPSGLGLDHRSETSSGETADGLHVFLNAGEAESLSEGIGYGDEVVVLEAERHWASGDVEGVCVDGAAAQIVARVPHAEFRASEWESASAKDVPLSPEAAAALSAGLESARTQAPVYLGSFAHYAEDEAVPAPDQNPVKPWKVQAIARGMTFPEKARWWFQSRHVHSWEGFGAGLAARSGPIDWSKVGKL
jgi:hypothetical protein